MELSSKKFRAKHLVMPSANSHEVSLATLGFRLLNHISPSRKKQFFIQIALGILVSLTEMASIGATLPFLALLSSPSQFLNNQYVISFLGSLEFISSKNLIYFFTAIFIVAILLAMLMRLLLIWTNSRLASGLGSDLSCLIYRKTLYQPYLMHINTNSGSVISGILQKLNTVIYGVIYPFLVLVSSLILLSIAIVLVSSIYPVLTFFLLLVFISVYASVMGLVKHRLKRNSFVLATQSTKILKILQESLGGIRDILIDGTQEIFAVAYKISDSKFRRAEAQGTLISQGPRYLIEAIAVCLIAGVACWFTTTSDSSSLVIPILGAGAVGAQRLLPVVQQSYAAWVSIQNSRGSLIEVVGLLDQKIPNSQFNDDKDSIVFEKSIELRNAFFRYSSESDYVLSGASIEIQKGSRIGVVGSSGSGKSTLMDILMGLLKPERGDFLVDGIAIDLNNPRCWQKKIAHVPQNIYLSDASISENIAFGVPTDLINKGRVEWAAEQACLEDVINRLPNGYNTSIGEGGIKLSGGQRQRIGIARALYKSAEVIILDEATSALDNNTENSVMQTIKGLNHNLTIIIVAHRLTTLIGCDRIIELEGGCIVGEGTYDEIVSPKLRSFI
jgi:ATP-binding cassette subfamily B protein